MVLYAVMGLHVTDVVRPGIELSITLSTLCYLLPSVDATVFLKIVRSGTHLLTDVTFVCNLLPSVDPTVYLKMASLGKHLLTDVTFVSHSRMNALDVYGENDLMREGLVAVTAGVRLFPCVHSLM